MALGAPGSIGRVLVSDPGHVAYAQGLAFWPDPQFAEPWQGRVRPDGLTLRSAVTRLDGPCPCL
jgi:hypothetical protein